MNRPAAWTDEELRLLTTVYACMLHHEAQGTDYTKSAHNKWLQKRIDRTGPAIEFKFANLSAALEDAGNSYIPGYTWSIHAGRSRSACRDGRGCSDLGEYEL